MAKIDVSVQTGDQPAPPPSHPNTCPSCHSHYRDDELEQSLWVCRQCGHHFPMRARSRIDSLVDPGTFEEEAAELHSEDPLGFFDLRPYTERLAEAEMKTGLADAMVIGRGAIDGRQCELAVMDFAFMGGSMGSVVGEKFSRACDSAAEAGMPLDLRHELGRRADAGGDPRAHAAAEDGRGGRGSPRLRPGVHLVMAHPTTGGVLASFATLGDILLAEPNALMSFAGPRVVQEITREKLPDDFGRAEQNVRYGQIDAIVSGRSSAPTLSRLLRLFDAPQ